jgi:hypothetical protein
MSSGSNGGYLYPDECMVSQNKAYKFCYQSDGNIVLYDQEDRQIWSAGAAGAGGGEPFVLNLDFSGRLMAWNGNGTTLDNTYWLSSNPTVPEEGPFDASLQDDGNMVIRRRRDDKIVWSTSPGKCC